MIQNYRQKFLILVKVKLIQNTQNQVEMYHWKSESDLLEVNEDSKLTRQWRRIHYLAMICPRTVRMTLSFRTTVSFLPSTAKVTLRRPGNSDKRPFQSTATRLPVFKICHSF